MMQRIGVVYPFTFNLQKKNTQEGKEENIKKVWKSHPLILQAIKRIYTFVLFLDIERWEQSEGGRKIK